MCPMRSAPDSDVLARYLGQTASPAEQEIVERWAAAHVSHQAELDVLVRAHEQTGVPPADAPTWDTVALWARVHRDLRTPATPAGATDHLRSSARQPQPWPRGMGERHARQVRLSVPYRVAAALVCAVVFSSGVVWRLAGKRVDRHETEARVYATGRAVRETVRLADGTRVTLAPASRLRVPGGYGGPGREVFLDGEAYFAVVHDATRPFTVHAANAVTTDVGTAFDVRAYGGDSTVRVVIAEGQATVAAFHGAVVSASAGDLAVVNGGGGMQVVHGIASQDYTAWCVDQLVFRDASLAQVGRDLERWYDVDLQVADSALNERRLNVRLRIGPLDELVDALAAAVGARITHSGHTVRFALARSHSHE